MEELEQQGKHVSVEEICSTCPDLAEELGRRIALLDKAAPLLGDMETAPGDPIIVASASRSSRQYATSSHYRDLRFHAAGALGEVFMAQERGAQPRCRDIKFLKAERAGDPESCRRFLLEAEVTSRLEHPGVVPIYALGTDGIGCAVLCDAVYPGGDPPGLDRRLPRRR